MIGTGKPQKPASPLGWTRPAWLLGALVLQGAAAVFFVNDSLTELFTDADKTHALTEAPVALALCIGVWLTIREFRRLSHRAAAQDRALALASSAFVDVVEAQFTGWGLTRAERDVAWLTLRGVDVPDIARMRNAASGTVRAQMARIYAKSGVTSRAQFAALLVDRLMGNLPDRLDPR